MFLVVLRWASAECVQSRVFFTETSARICRRRLVRGVSSSRLADEFEVRQEPFWSPLVISLLIQDVLLVAYGAGLVTAGGWVLHRRFGAEMTWWYVVLLGVPALIFVCGLGCRALVDRYHDRLDQTALRCQRMSGESIKDWRQRAADMERPVDA